MQPGIELGWNIFVGTEMLWAIFNKVSRCNRGLERVNLMQDMILWTFKGSLQSQVCEICIFFVTGSCVAVIMIITIVFSICWQYSSARWEKHLCINTQLWKTITPLFHCPEERCTLRHRRWASIWLPYDGEFRSFGSFFSFFFYSLHIISNT